MDQQFVAETFGLGNEAARTIQSQANDLTNDAIARNFYRRETSWFGEGAGRSRGHQERACCGRAAPEVASIKACTHRE